MTETELKAEIANVEKAISNALLLGEEYEIENSSSKRRTKSVSLSELRKYKANLEQQLAGFSNSSGFVGGF